jgi:hypothetical protein
LGYRRCAALREAMLARQHVAAVHASVHARTPNSISSRCHNEGRMNTRRFA